MEVLTEICNSCHLTGCSGDSIKASLLAFIYAKFKGTRYPPTDTPGFNFPRLFHTYADELMMLIQWCPWL